MHLYVSPMDCVVTDYDEEGRILIANEDWSTPTLQEQRAVIYAARDEMARLMELIEILEAKGALAAAKPDSARPEPHSR